MRDPVQLSPKHRLPRTRGAAEPLTASTGASGLHPTAAAAPSDAKHEEAERRLAEMRIELLAITQERDALAARLASALEELEQLRRPAATMLPGPEDDDFGVESIETGDRAAVPPVAPPPLPGGSTPSLEPRADVVASARPPELPASAPPVISGAPPDISFAPVASPSLSPSPSMSSELSRLVVSTHPPAPDSERPSSPDRRSLHRRPCEFDVEFLGDTHFTTGLTQDISEGGVFVATYQSLPIGTSVSLAFELPTGHRVDARGEVRWVRSESEDASSRPGLGIAFTEFGPGALERIIEYCGASAAHYYEF